MSEWICKARVGENPKATLMKAWEVSVLLQDTVKVETPDNHSIEVGPADNERSLKAKYEATLG